MDRLDYPQTCEWLERLSLSMRDRVYDGVPVFGAIRLPIDMIFKDRYRFGPAVPALQSLRLVLWCVREFLRLVLDRMRSPAPAQDGRDDAIIMMIDHDSSRYYEMQFTLAETLGLGRVVVLTQEDRLVQRLRALGLTVVDVSSIQGRHGFQFRHLRETRDILSHSQLRAQGWLFCWQVGIILLRTFARIEGYDRWIDRRWAAAVVSLQDTHSNEFVISHVARSKGLATFTLQPGWLDLTSAPVTSDYALLWGQSSCDALTALGVPTQKLLIAGKPGLDEDLAWAGGDPSGLRESFRRRCGIGNGLLVGYFATDWGPAENRALFECFAALDGLAGLAPFVKLKPNASPATVSRYSAWIEELMPKSAPPIVSRESGRDCFAAADVLVTFHSSASIEAMPFGVIVILLDPFAHPRLDELVPNYHDVLVARSGTELRVMLTEFVSSPERASRAKQDATRAAARHFDLIPGRTSTERIASLLAAGNPARLSDTTNGLPIR